MDLKIHMILKSLSKKVFGVMSNISGYDMHYYDKEHLFADIHTRIHVVEHHNHSRDKLSLV